MKLHKVGMWVVAALGVATALADGTKTVPVGLRIFPGEYRDESKGTDCALPCAWGIHFRPDEPVGWSAVWLRVKTRGDGQVKVFVNRVFEPIAPERGDFARPQAKPFGQQVGTGLNWVKVPLSGRRELRFEVSSDVPATCDLAVLVKDGKLDVSAFDAATLEAIPHRAPRSEFADRLFERNPLMPLREYAERVARANGVEPKAPVPHQDENGAALHCGKPYFPLMIYHSTFCRSESLLADVPLNVYPDRIPLEPSAFPRYLMFCGFMFHDRCYSDYFAIARGQANADCVRRNAIAYLFDEPDNHYDVIGQRRLNELVKVVVPETPTLFCNCCFASLGEQCRACDYPCFDHYPIGKPEPWNSVEAIRYMVAKSRLESADAPTFFVVQTYDQSKFMPFEGGKFNPNETGFPTERELTAMTFLPIAVGARGLFFFNFRELYGEKRTLPEFSPDGWACLKRLIGQLHVMESVLIGPEIKLPWTASGQASVRLLVSADRKRGYLLAVNPTLHEITETLEPQLPFPMASTQYDEVANYGVASVFEPSGKIVLKMEELGTVLYRLSPDGLSALRKATREERFAELRRWASRGTCTDEAARLGRRGQKRPAAPEKPQHFEWCGGRK